jgi:heavy metal sensor kinase
VIALRFTIRWRLTLWNLLALALVLLAFAALVYALVARSLYRGLDSRLALAFDQLRHDRRLSSEADNRLAHWIAEFKEHEGFFCVVYGRQGKLRQRSEELAIDSVPARPDEVTTEPTFRDLNLPGINRQRTLICRLQPAEEELDVLLLAPLADVDRELEHLRTALAAAVPGILLFSGVLGYFLARKALSPVSRLKSLTDEITADRLDRRLPVDNPDDELGRLTRTINAMIGRLEHSFVEIRRFTADASHELRTPLAAIRAEAEVALTRSQTEPEVRELLGSILEECARLTRLTEQLLSLAREDDRVETRREPVQLNQLVVRIGDTMRPVAEASRLQLNVESDEEAIVTGDRERLRQVVYNLLDNAIKYTPAGGLVEVRVKRALDRAILTVRDTGVGIPAEHLPRVFDRFYRVDKVRSREMGGTGLGLSIVRSIVQAHGGEIILGSEPGKGTTCTVSFPISPEG